MKAHIITWLLSVLSACIIGAAWVYTHPTPKMVQVNLRSLVDEEARRLASVITPETPKDKQEKAFKDASELGRKIDLAVSQIARECGCVVINSGAIVAQPGNAAKAVIPDVTERARELIGRM